MATAKKGLLDKALVSKPVVATKKILSKAVEVATDAFNDPPLAPDLANKPLRRAPAKSTKKRTTGKTTATKSMDRKLVSTMEDYEVKYLATKHGVTQKAVKEAVVKVGHSRNKVETELKRGKGTTGRGTKRS